MSSTSPQKPRASQDQRSQATRERLIAATIECIAAKGLAHATTAEISERAGVSSGARVHHFKSKMDLVNAAICFTYEQATVESLGTAETAQSQREPLRCYIEDAYQFYMGPRYLMQHEVVNAARTSPELMEVVQPAANAYRAAVNDAWLDVFRRAGHSRSWSKAAMDLSVVIVRGLALGSFLRGRGGDADILKIWREVMARYPDTGSSKPAHAKPASARRA